MSDSVWPHRRQPTRLLCSWDSSGKNTGVGCHFLLQCMKVKSEKWKWSRSVVPTLSNPMDCSLPDSSIHGIFQARVLEWVPLSSLLVNISFSKLWEIAKDREVWHAVVHGVAKSTTELSNWIATMSLNYVIYKMRMVKILWGLDKTKCANLGSW